MERHNKRLTNMMWRSMGESIGLSLVLFGVIVYFLIHYGYLKEFTSWSEGIQMSLTLILIVVIIGGVYGIWYSGKMKSRLEQLGEVMLALEKGNLTRTVPRLVRMKSDGSESSLTRLRKNGKSRSARCSGFPITMRSLRKRPNIRQLLKNGSGWRESCMMRSVNSCSQSR